MRVFKLVVAIVFGIVIFFLLGIWSIIDSLNHGDALPLITAIGVPVGILIWTFLKDEDRKQEEERERRGERKFWGDDI